MSKIGLGLIGSLGLLAASGSVAFAHVIVKPDTVGVAAFQTFSVGVPNEKDNPAISLRLLIPDGLSSVVPNVKSGWSIEVKKSGTGDNAKVTEIDWTGGSIPPEERDDFLFQAQVPGQPATLNWKAYETYSDGVVVAWDANPSTMSKMSDEEQDKMINKDNKGPYSTTMVVNDLTAKATPQIVGFDSVAKIKIIEAVAGLALILSIASLYLSTRKK